MRSEFVALKAEKVKSVKSSKIKIKGIFIPNRLISSILLILFRITWLRTDIFQQISKQTFDESIGNS
jgi:hypothetical protein